LVDILCVHRDVIDKPMNEVSAGSIRINQGQGVTLGDTR